ncbi:hypothetical protein BU25DRAFT_459022 [Macroventuria anomochaeta]|uniref:Uncharacterized protein n=1 Tax=Macroventuria anomochaeta TaxID=301207 RepID=A0ACB6RZ31_9PLEO|nr:uncharacterized protein BU25DRAFT_459022 [Macroventuria anomochaeta]KAF2627240.1 hypothetical protein BU25DRAFT_459022 [Macroventuria anomochaeta]
MVHVRDQDDNIRTNVRKGLDIIIAENYAPRKQMPPPSTTEQRASRRDGISSLARQKRSSSCTDTPLPPSKRTCSSSPTKPAIANRVHRCIIVHDYEKPIYRESSQNSLLAAFKQCIIGYKSLHTRAGMLQRSISPNNLLVNEDKGNLSWPALLMDLDLAIKEQREQASGACRKTGMRAFKAIGVLLDDEQHLFMHDLKSFFWVLFWICIHYDGQQERIVPRFDKWNYLDAEELASPRWTARYIQGLYNK